MDRQEMIRSIKEKVLLPLEGYNMGDCSKPIDDQSTECIEFIYNLLG